MDEIDRDSTPGVVDFGNLVNSKYLDEEVSSLPDPVLINNVQLMKKSDDLSDLRLDRDLEEIDKKKEIIFSSTPTEKILFKLIKYLKKEGLDSISKENKTVLQEILTYDLSDDKSVKMPEGLSDDVNQYFVNEIKKYCESIVKSQSNTEGLNDKEVGGLFLRLVSHHPSRQPPGAPNPAGGGSRVKSISKRIRKKSKKRTKKNKKKRKYTKKTYSKRSY